MQLGGGNLIFTGMAYEYPGHRLPLGVRNSQSATQSFGLNLLVLTTLTSTEEERGVYRSI
jgi:hypothetical protein